jgi:fibro-slime domain-containing protein
MTRIRMARANSGCAPRIQLAFLCLGAVAALTAAGCSSASVIDQGQGGGQAPGGAKGGSTGSSQGGAGGGTGWGTILTTPDAGIDRPAGGNCGDGIIQRNESCDDGNSESGDGCSQICQLENNFICPEEGKPCKNLAECGNSILTSDETCDDGNKADGDGCSKDCKKVEPGWQCRVPGKPCTPKCGDGVVSGTETCDDGNTSGGDGCSATCHLEIGYKCEGSPTKCSKTKCGDGKVEGGEGCDDSNNVPFDKCSQECQIEPDCSGTSCTSKCGDGIVLGEECDDGNAASGDGCSKECRKEPGWTCTQPEIGDKIMVPVVYRDFKFKNPTDFEGGVTGQNDPSTGMVKDTLDKDGKPEYANPATPGGGVHVASATSFSQWYRNTSGVNSASAGKLALWNDGKGAYVNRYGENGEQWQITAPANWCGTVADALLDDKGKPIPCTFRYQAGLDGGNGGMTDCQKMEAQGYTLLPGSCINDGGTYKAQYIVGKTDGNPLFFPVDGDKFTPASELTAAQIPSEPKGLYDASNTWPFESGKPLHNFSFTSEVRYWFKYESGKTYKLEFVGDDDVWVFINRKLALDLGGIHTPVPGSVEITPTKAKSLGNMETGKVYEIAVFQAERQTTCSSYKLTLSGFNAAPTSCVPTCGDGEVVADEECDCGTNPDKFPARCTGPNNDETYGGCTTQCKWGTYCGDGIQNGPEQCDLGPKNGTNNERGGCTVGCTTTHYCGDKIVDTDRLEQCDMGDKNGKKLDKDLNLSDAEDAQIYCKPDCTIPAGVIP